MERIQISKIHKYVGKSVKLYGWVQALRAQGAITFIELRDISGIVQLVIEKQVTGFTEISSVPLESVISLTGKVQQIKGRVEVLVGEYEVLSKPVKKLPISVVRKGFQETKLKKRLDYRVIDLRKEKSAYLFKLMADIQGYFRAYLKRKGFIEAVTPKILSSPSESKAELFEIQYFGKKAYLAQSSQFYKQMAMAAGFEKFFTFGDTYREDPSSTIWHVAQFTTLDIEMSFIKSEEDLYKFEERMLSSVMKTIKKYHQEQISKYFEAEIVVPKLPFPRIPMEKAIEIVRGEMGSPEKGEDLSSSEEKLLCKWVKKKYGHEFVFLTEFPVSVRPFYHMKKSEATTRSADLLYKEREIFTTAQREHRYEVLKAQIIEKGLDVKKMQHVLDIFAYGCPPHGGLGFGFERFIKLMLGISNIRECFLAPRDMKRLTP